MSGGELGKIVLASIVRKTKVRPRRRSATAVVLAGMLFMGMVAVMTSARKSTVSNVSLPKEPVAIIQDAPQVESATTTTSNPLVPVDTDALDAYLTEWIKDHPGQQWAVQVTGVNADFSAGVNEHDQFELASIYKLFLIAPLTTKVPSAHWESLPINGQTYQHCVNIMLSKSDNPCAQAISDSLGWNSINRQLKAADYDDTDFTGKDFLRSSAHDTALLLTRLHDGEGYDGQTRRIVMEALADQRLRQGIPAGCEGCAVWNKTGDWNGNRHDAAIISSNGIIYTLSIMSRGGTWAQIAEMTRGINGQIAVQKQ